MFSKCVAGMFGICSVLLLAPPALANHDHPDQAKSYNVSLVRAYQRCDTSATGTQSEATHKGPLFFSFACKPPVTSSYAASPTSWRFGPHGHANLSLMPKHGDILISLSGYDIEDGAGLASGAGGLRINFRRTDHGCEAPDYNTPCTSLDQENEGDDPTSVPSVQWSDTGFGVNNGKVKVKSSVNTWLAGITTDPDAGYHAGDQTNLEVLSVAMTDENGELFAVPGLYLP